ncbi:MAG TPA: DUF6760 family protein [Actinomycetota bacterium]|nr:DUF6760 family protein [Actinomycetota bacterium]
MTRPAAELYSQAAYLAFHFHWSLDEILDLSHPVRDRFVAEAGRLVSGT